MDDVQNKPLEAAVQSLVPQAQLSELTELPSATEHAACLQVFVDDVQNKPQAGRTTPSRAPHLLLLVAPVAAPEPSATTSTATTGAPFAPGATAVVPPFPGRGTNGGFTRKSNQPLGFLGGQQPGTQYGKKAFEFGKE